MYDQLGNKGLGGIQLSLPFIALVASLRACTHHCLQFLRHQPSIFSKLGTTAVVCHTGMTLAASIPGTARGCAGCGDATRHAGNEEDGPRAHTVNMARNNGNSREGETTHGP